MDNVSPFKMLGKLRVKIVVVVIVVTTISFLGPYVSHHIDTFVIDV